MINEKEIIEIAKQVISDMTYDDITSSGNIGICATFQDILYNKTSLPLAFKFSTEWLVKNFKEYSGIRVYPVPSPNVELSAVQFFNCGDSHLTITSREREEYKQNRLKLLEVMKKNPDFKIDVIYSIIHIIL